MAAREIKCELIESQWLTPTVIYVRFKTKKIFKFEPGQFVSLYIPDPTDSVKPTARKRPIRRAYTLAGPVQNAKQNGYELCVKYVPGGVGSEFLKSLKPGQTFKATAPYGDFVFAPPAPGRSICLMGTGTGIAPFRAFILSKEFQEIPPQNVTCLMGAKTLGEALFQNEFKLSGYPTTFCISQNPTPISRNISNLEKSNLNFFTGRITDYLKNLPTDWSWHTTDFYLCGNQEMIHDVEKILVGGHGVNPKHIFKEAFSRTPHRITQKAA